MSLTNELLNETFNKLGHYGQVELVNLEDTISFNCKRCGKCCSGRTDIIVNPYDVYKIAKTLNIIGAHNFNMRTLRSRPMKELQWNYYSNYGDRVNFFYFFIFFLVLQWILI